MNNSNKIYLVNGSEPHFRGKFAIAAQKLEIPYEYVDLKECIFLIDGEDTYLYQNNAQIKPDNSYFLIRKKETDSYFCYLLTEFLHRHDTPFLDPGNRSHTLAHTKISQLLTLTGDGILFPRSIICRPYSYTLHRDMVAEQLGFPLVLKRNGARGEAVWLIDNEAELESKFAEAPFEAHILQKYIPNESDLRVIVFEDTVLGAMQRTSSDGFANAGYDATLEIVEITEEEKQLAIHASKKAGIDFSGVDIVRTDAGLRIWEVNKCPQIERFIAATDIEIVEIMLNTMKNKYLANTGD